MEPVQFENIPSALKQYPQWVGWKPVVRDGKLTKVPIDLKTGKLASTTDPGTWSEYQMTTFGHGLGFVFTQHDPFIGVDLDHCKTARGVSGLAARWLTGLNSYAEWSPSGDGIHIIVRGHLSGSARRSAKVPGLEIYDQGRFFTVTGNRLEHYPRFINDRQQWIDDLYEEHFGTEVVDLSKPAAAPSYGEAAFSDEAVIAAMRNHYTWDKIGALWEGDLSGYHDDHSSADLALCGHLAWWCNGNVGQMDRLFRTSGLMRDKWDQRRGGHITYGERTILKALEKERNNER